MRGSSGIYTTLMGLLCIMAQAGGVSGADLPGIPPETVADYIHAVIEAHRTVYTIHVVERQQKKGKVVASESWRTKNTLPLPAQFLKESDELGALTGTKVRYRLISLWPINKQNAPTTEFEQAGLEEVQQHPERPHTGIVTSGSERYFQAVYADRAVTQACIGCHNAHPRSPKKDFKLHDIMGGIVITIPVSQ